MADAGELRAIADALCDDGAVSSCGTSAAFGAGAPFAGLVELTAPSSGVEALLDRLEPTLDAERHAVLEVVERHVVTYDRAVALGTPSPGERVVTVVVRKPSMSRDEFAAYWKDVHTDVALSYTVPMSGYTQYVTRRQLFGNRSEPDGVLVMSFESAEQRRARYEDHPEDSARGAADAEIFMDLTRTTAVLMNETIWR